MKAFDKLRSWLQRKLSDDGEGLDDDLVARAPSTLPQPVASHVPPPPDCKPMVDQGLPASQQPAGPCKVPEVKDFFAEYGEASRYTIQEIIGKGSYGIVASAIDNFTGERVAIKKITNVFEHVSDATRILREIKLLRLLKHPDVVEIKHIMLPPSAREYRDIYVVFELMETDLHQVIKANDDLTPEHHQFFLYQMLRGLKYIHSAKVYHRDLKPKNILASSDCKLKICDFGLARPAISDTPTTIFWTDYVATRWYRAPELCGSFYAKYTPAIDLWSIGCIFAEVLLGKPLFAGRNVVHQLEIITDLLGTPSADVIAKVKNDKARRFLAAMPKKAPVSFTKHFPRAQPAALELLKLLLSFDPNDRPTAEQALAHPYFASLHNPAREPVSEPVSKLAFEFDRRKLTMDDVRDLIYRETLEYHPHVLEEFRSGKGRRLHLVYPSAVENFKRQFAHLEASAQAAAEAADAATTAATGEAGPTSSPVSPERADRPPSSDGSLHIVCTDDVAADAASKGSSAKMNRHAVDKVSRALTPAISLPKAWLPDFSLDPQQLTGQQGGRMRSGSGGGGIVSQSVGGGGGGDVGGKGVRRVGGASDLQAASDVLKRVGGAGGWDAGGEGGELCGDVYGGNAAVAAVNAVLRSRLDAQGGQQAGRGAVAGRSGLHRSDSHC